VVKCLLSHGTDASIQNNDGWTALHYAAEKGHLEVVNLLLSHKANTSEEDNSGSTALHYAGYYGHLEVVNCLLSHGADTSIQNRTGCTVLYCAVNNGHLKVVKCLLSHGADTSIRDNYGHTALHIARMRGHIAIVEYLYTPFFRSYVIAISCAVRGGQLNLACGPFLVSYLHRGFGMSMRDVRLVQGVIFRTYFQQFEVADVVEESEEDNSENI